MGEEALKDLLARLPEMAEAVNKFEGEEVQREALAALLEAWQDEQDAGSGQDHGAATAGNADDERAESAGVPEAEEQDQDVVSPKEVNFHPEGEPDFREVVKEKKPSTHRDKCLLAVYYMKMILGLPKVSHEHVKEAYRNATWKFPSSLKNTLSQTSGKEGWLDTSDMNDITLTLTGENRVEHDMPEPD